MKFINVKNTNNNMTPYIVSLSDNGLDDTCVQFEKGKYGFDKDGCFEGVFYPSNNRSGNKNVVFPLISVSNVVIDGGGAEFVFYDRIFPFIIKDSKNVVIKNFSADFSFPRSFYAEVAAIDDEKIEFKYDEKLYDIFIDDEHRFCMGRGKTAFKTDLFLMRGSERNAGIGYAGAWYVSTSCDGGINDELPASTLKMDAEVLPGGRLVLKYRENIQRINYGVGMQIIFSLENRENIMFFVDNCENVSFENINVYRSAGMGIQAQISDNVTAKGVRFIPKEERGEKVSVTADAFHFVNCGGKVTLFECVVEGTGDDALNVHGVYTAVEKVLSDNRIEVKLCHYEQKGLVPYKIGDRIVISDDDLRVEKQEYKVLAVQQGRDKFHIVLSLDKEARGIVNPGDLVENPDRMPNVTVENCEINACPHLRVSGNKKIVLRNNKISYIAGILINDLIDYWYESGRVNDVLIENNIIRNSYNGVIMNGLHDKKMIAMHKNVIIKNNRISTHGGCVLSAKGVDGLVFKNNVIENVMESGSVVFEKCKNVTIENNEYEVR